MESKNNFLSCTDAAGLSADLEGGAALVLLGEGPSGGVAEACRLRETKGGMVSVEVNSRFRSNRFKNAERSVQRIKSHFDLGKRKVDILSTL